MILSKYQIQVWDLEEWSKLEIEFHEGSAWKSRFKAVGRYVRLLQGTVK